MFLGNRSRSCWEKVSPCPQVLNLSDLPAAAEKQGNSWGRLRRSHGRGLDGVGAPHTLGQEIFTASHPVVLATGQVPSLVSPACSGARHRVISWWTG